MEGGVRARLCLGHVVIVAALLVDSAAAITAFGIEGE